MDNASSLIDKARRHSRYLDQQLFARPWLAPMIEPVLGKTLERQDIEGFLNTDPLTESTLGPRLRALRTWVYAHTMVRDLAGLASLEDVTGTMTLLADVAVNTALRVLTAHLAQRHGRPRNAMGQVEDLIVVGMGKLGGCELNVSSDIDLIFAYTAEGDTDGPRPLDAFEFFTRLGRLIIQAIAELTAEGYVFRVDMRLRPNGDSGPLVGSLDMLETYFITQGREWERYAWIKARVLTGNHAPELDAISRPFVYRKYLDFGAINAMRSLHAQIRREVARREMADNVKLGPGGIREIEFIAQVFQLIRGGGDKGLQIRPTLKVLDALAQRGQLPASTVEELSAAYQFLRKLEHRIQYLDDAQTHKVPDSESDRALLAESMGFDRYESLREALDTHRNIVSRHFEEVFSDPVADEHPLDNVWTGACEAGPTSECLLSLHFQDPDGGAERLSAFRNSARLRSMSEDARDRLDALMPRILELCGARPNSDETLTRAIALLEAICRRAVYLALLQQYPHALSRLIELLSASSWVAGYVTQHPLLLDELLDNRSLSDAPDWHAIAAELSERMDSLGDDTERQMDVMREAHHAYVFRILNQDLAGNLTVERLSDHLSALADLVLEETLRLCWSKVPRKHTPAHRFAILGYGKLGGKELGYASDLDLVFVHDDPDPDCQIVYARLAQRINTWLDSHTAAGHLFETDTRLRPNGDSGLIVVSLEAFEKYQRENAWVWEHQALTRARFCAGNKEVGAKFERIRDELLAQARDVPALRHEVLNMRRKMYEAHANKGSGFELKHDHGGLIDVEFIVQFIVLAYAYHWPEFCGNKGNIALLRLAGNVGLLPPDVAERAADAYRELRRKQHELRLNQHASRVFDDSLEKARDAVRQTWQLVFGKEDTL